MPTAANMELIRPERVETLNLAGRKPLNDRALAQPLLEGITQGGSVLKVPLSDATSPCSLSIVPTLGSTAACPGPVFCTYQDQRRRF